MLLAALSTRRGPIARGPRRARPDERQRYQCARAWLSAHATTRNTRALRGALALDEEQRQRFEAAAARSGLPRRLGGASVTVGPWDDATIPNLPLALTSFVGRDAELDEIATLIRDHRMVTLTGAGGVGKTQTALHVGPR